jgi:hypothetical protein
MGWFFLCLLLFFVAGALDGICSQLKEIKEELRLTRLSNSPDLNEEPHIKVKFGGN